VPLFRTAVIMVVLGGGKMQNIYRSMTLRHWATVRGLVRVTVDVCCFAAWWPCSYLSRKPYSSTNPSHAGGPAAFKELLLGLHFTVVFSIISTVVSTVRKLVLQFRTFYCSMTVLNIPVTQTLTLILMLTQTLN